MRFLLRTLAAVCLISPGLAAERGRQRHKFGMTLQEAQENFLRTCTSRRRRQIPTAVHYSFCSKNPITGSDIDDEAFTIEAVDGKVAYVKQIITYSPARAIDRQEFQQSLVPQ